MTDNALTEQEEKFCLIYAAGPVPYIGNAKKTYDLVFKGSTARYLDTDVEEEVNTSIAVQKLMQRDDIKTRIDEWQSKNIVSAATLRPKLTETLLRIADECSTLTVEDKWGKMLSPAALRAVAVNAISKLTDMYGIKEDIAHKVMLEGADGDGITFNLVVPQKDNEISGLIDD